MTIPPADPFRRICVFCGSSTGIGDEYVLAAAELGKLLAKRGIGVVYGGARVGTMGVLADAALDAGGEVYGVIPESLLRREIGHRGLTELQVVAGLHERKAKMAELAEGFIALPGGAGTMEELFEVWTWAQLGLHDKPIGLLDVNGYFQPLLRFADHMAEQGFLCAEYREMIAVDANSAQLLDALSNYRPPARKWANAHQQ